MKMNVDERLNMVGEYVELETLIEKGRQLHSNAVFEFCANIFKRKRISHTNFNIKEQGPRLVDSH